MRASCPPRSRFRSLHHASWPCQSFLTCVHRQLSPHRKGWTPGVFSFLLSLSPRIVLPLVKPLADYLASLPASDNPNAFIFPRAASAKRTASLSNQFRDIMADAGVVETRAHEARGKGRNQAREASEISFHSLRHSAVTMLKAAGASDFIAREIVGHAS